MVSVCLSVCLVRRRKPESYESESGLGEGGGVGEGERAGYGGGYGGGFPVRLNLNPEGFEARRDQLLLAKAENECV